MSLREYARKRRFGNTPEPDEAASSKRGQRPMFVVQLHHARARHYDFRLEMDGALKSWAVPKGPSLRVGEKRLAVEVEDHPLDYADFEGDIPQGNYGAGHVEIFDRGVWTVEGDPLAGVAAGKLDFALHGSKLNGAWKLVRTQQVRSGKPQWLLIKRDDAFSGDTEADDLVAAKPSRKRRINWEKRASALAGAHKLPRTWRPPAPQLAALGAKPPSGDEWLHELKWDGYRMLAEIADGKVALRSRNDLDWTPDYPGVVSAFERMGLDQASFDGELIALTPEGSDDFGLLQKVISGSSNAPLRYMLFDLPSLAGHDLKAVALEDRKALLADLVKVAAPILAFSQHIVGHGPEVFAASKRQGMEGIISKRRDASYAAGRSRSWLKAKHAQGDEFIIVGYTAPKRSRTGFGALLMATRYDGALKYVGRVGTGFDERQLHELHARMQPLVRKKATVVLPSHIPFAPRDVTWIKPELTAELEYRGWGNEGLLRQASFKGLRLDKSAEDIGVKDSGVEPRGAQPARLSSPDKLIFPALGITKQQVHDYYAAVAPLLLPELARRPLSMVRCPDGIAGDCFFQKHHASTLGEHVHAVAIKEKGGGSEDYVYVDGVAGVVDLVQMNVLEFHPWGARIDDIEHPDRLVFDLDPGPGVGWNAVKAGAREIRARLRDAGLEGFLRLSGGKGVHIVVPIAPVHDWPTAKSFCEAFARAMEAHAPQRYVATASKARRKGVIFIDWLRNGRGATSVSNWSLRARPEAGVALPLAWRELGRTNAGNDYPMARALRRASAQRKDPWLEDGWAEALEQQLPEL